jgi:hypothetical protein
MLRVMAETSLLERLTIINLRQRIKNPGDFLPLNGQLWEELDGVLKGSGDVHRNLYEVVLCFKTAIFVLDIEDHPQTIVEARMPLVRAAGSLYVTIAHEDINKKRVGAYDDRCREFSNLTLRL